MIGRRVAGLITETTDSIDIDTPLDWRWPSYCWRSGTDARARRGPRVYRPAARAQLGAPGLGEVLVCRQTGRALPEPLGVPAREFTSLDDALAEQPDVVLVTNPTSLHVQTALRAVQTGAHVLVEKPLSHSLDGVDALLQAERVVMVGYNLRFHPGLQRLRQLVHTVRSGGWCRTRGGRRVPARLASLGGLSPGYSAQRNLGGGPVLTFSHELTRCYWLLGAPASVTAVTGHASSLDIDTEDVAEMVLSYPNGVLASVHVDYVRREARRTLEVVGEAGILRWEYEATALLPLRSRHRCLTNATGRPTI